MAFLTILIASLIYTAGVIGILDPTVDPTNAFTHLIQ